MGYRLLITELAKHDARDYAHFIRKREKVAEPASRWLNGLAEAVSGLSEMPTRFDVVDEAPLLGRPYRAFRYHSHRVVFLVHEGTKTVVVHRIWHAARGRIDGL